MIRRPVRANRGSNGSIWLLLNRRNDDVVFGERARKRPMLGFELARPVTVSPVAGSSEAWQAAQVTLPLSRPTGAIWPRAKSRPVLIGEPAGKTVDPSRKSRG